ncbi:Acyl-CoA dehydrogenase family member 11, partial [Durusdinium trenchii]
AGYTGGQNYTVTVTSTGTFAQKVTCSSGMFGDDDTSNQPTKAMSQTHTWTAPTSGAPASFAAACGDSTEMNLAAHVSMIRMATGTSAGATRSAGALLSLTLAAALYLLKF